MLVLILKTIESHFPIRIILLVLLFITAGSTGFSQSTQRLDSLENVLKNRKGIDRFDPLVEIVRAYLDVDNNKALVRARAASEIAYSFGDTIKIIRSQRILGQILRRLDRYSEGEEILLKILPVAQRQMNDDGNLTAIYNTLAVIYSFQGYHDKALYYNFKSLEMREQSGNKADISVSCNNIGIAYYNLDNFDKAISYYLRSLKLKEEIGDNYDLDRLLINLSLCYAFKKQFPLATKYLQDALSICKGSCSPEKEIEIKFARGIVSLGEFKYQEAKQSFLTSYKISVETGNRRFQLENLDLLIELCFKDGNFNLAKEYLEKADALARNLIMKSLQIKIWGKYARFYDHSHDYRNAASYQAKYIHLRDSLYSEELTQNLMVVQAEYEQRENKAKIESQDKELALKEEVINRQNTLTIVAGVAIVLLGLLILALYRNNQQKKAVNIVLEQKVKERTKQLEVSYELIQKAYQDQNHFISKTTNDIKSPLSTMKGICSLGLKELRDQDAQQYLNQLNDTTDQLALMVNKLVSNNL